MASEKQETRGIYLHFLHMIKSGQFRYMVTRMGVVSK